MVQLGDEAVHSKQGTEYLLISCIRRHEREALSEVWYILSDLNDIRLKIRKLSIPSLALLEVIDHSAIEAVNCVKRYAEEKGILFMTLKVKPFQVLIPTDEEAIIKKSSELAQQRLTEEDKWRINVKKRHTQLSSRSLIEKIAEFIKVGTVDLQNPNKLVEVDILGKWTGIGVIPVDAIYSNPEALERSSRIYY